MEENKTQQACEAQQEQTQPKKKGSTLKKVAKYGAVAGTGAVIMHEVMTKGGWTKAIVSGVKSLVNKTTKKDGVAIIEEETEVFVPRQNDRYNGERRDFGRDRRNFNNEKH